MTGGQPVDAGSGPASTPPYVLFGRRRGRRLRPQRDRLMQTLLPQLAIPVPVVGVPLDPAGLFAERPRAVWLEIGFGAGEHLLAQARAHPEAGCIGCEAYLNGVATLVAAWHTDPVPNMRILADDARLLLPLLQAASVERVFLLFPDPWPKLRHAGRRFICPHTVRELARVVVPGGEVRIATDAPAYARWALFHMCAVGAFRWTARSPRDWRTPPPDWVETRYQKRAERAARSPIYLSFIRAAERSG
ncbi:MAG: tRNA (guanine(46)-N(7))-methyltransferase TrmB [Rhodospirillales bacterium]